jgi:alpha-N-arabinofuranosidase
MGRAYIPLNESQVFADDALDLIEFANGVTSTKYGQIRASMGHGASFGLKRIEVGNEETLMGANDYPAHYRLITQAVWKVHPEMYVVASGRWGPSTNGHPCLTGQRCDAWDDHYYRTPDQMAAMASQYDNYARTMPDVFVGEWAANVGGKQTLQAAIAESAFLLGFEANADKVKSSSFAPLLRNVDGTQWAYDLINFDGSRLYALPSYDAQIMLRNARGDYTVRTVSSGLTKVTATVETSTGLLNIKAVNYGATANDATITIGGFRTVASTATVTTLTSVDGPTAENSFASPHHVQPVESNVPVAGGVLHMTVPAWSLVIAAVRVT